MLEKKAFSAVFSLMSCVFSSRDALAVMSEGNYEHGRDAACCVSRRWRSVLLTGLKELWQSVVTRADRSSRRITWRLLPWCVLEIEEVQHVRSGGIARGQGFQIEACFDESKP